MASSSSSTVGRCRRRVYLLRQPIHKDEYEGPRRYCHHRSLAPQWMAWTEGNQRRRFYGCQNYYKDGGYGYFAWHDGEFSERENTMIKELLDDVDRLYYENNMSRRGNDGRRFFEELDAI